MSLNWEIVQGSARKRNANVRMVQELQQRIMELEKRVLELENKEKQDLASVAKKVTENVKALKRGRPKKEKINA